MTGDERGGDEHDRSGGRPGDGGSRDSTRSTGQQRRAVWEVDVGWDRARVCAELTVQELWLRYVALGGVGDAFDVDAHLQGVHALPVFEQDVLAQAVNERLRELYHQTLVPLSTARPGTSDEAAVRAVVDVLLGRRDGGAPAVDHPEGGPRS